AESSSEARSPIVSTPARRSRSSARGPTPGSRRTSNGARNARSRPAGTTVIPPGLRRSLAILETTLHGETPSEHERLLAPRAAPTRRAPRLGHGPRLAEVGRHLPHVQVALVDAGLLDGRHDLAHRAPHGPRVLRVEPLPRLEEHRLRAAPQRLRARHRRVDPE